MLRFQDMPRLTVETVSMGQHGNCPSHDLLPLPGGRKVKDVPTDELRGILDSLGIPSAFTDGRATIVERYSRLVSNVFNTAGQKALDQFLLERESQCTRSD